MYTITPLRSTQYPNMSSAETQGYGLSARGDAAGVSFPQIQTSPNVDPITREIGESWRFGKPNGNFVLFLEPDSYLYSVNSNGHAVGAMNTHNSTTQNPIIAYNGAIDDLTPYVGNGAVASHINDRGQIVGWGWNRPESFVYDESSQLVDWISPLPGKSRSVATAINNAGQVVGRSDQNGFLYQAGVLKDLGPTSFVTSINDFGIACGSIGKAFPSNFVAAICDTSQDSPEWTPISPPSDFDGSHAEGMNNLGDVVGTCWKASTYNGRQTAYINSGGVKHSVLNNAA